MDGAAAGARGDAAEAHALFQVRRVPRRLDRLSAVGTLKGRRCIHVRLGPRQQRSGHRWDHVQAAIQQTHVSGCRRARAPWPNHPTHPRTWSGGTRGSRAAAGATYGARPALRQRRRRPTSRTEWPYSAFTAMSTGGGQGPGRTEPNCVPAKRVRRWCGSGRHWLPASCAPPAARPAAPPSPPAARQRSAWPNLSVARPRHARTHMNTRGSRTCRR
jgi:hypothetical protein